MDSDYVQTKRPTMCRLKGHNNNWYLIWTVTMCRLKGPNGNWYLIWTVTTCRLKGLLCTD